MIGLGKEGMHLKSLKVIRGKEKEVKRRGVQTGEGRKLRDGPTAAMTSKTNCKKGAGLSLMRVRDGNPVR